MNIHIVNDILEKYFHYILDEENYIIIKKSNISSQSTLRDLIAITLELDEQNIKYEIVYDEIIQLSDMQVLKTINQQETQL